MINHIEISPTLEKWAEFAGYSLTHGSRTADGRALFWSAGGETRRYVGTNDDGWFIITDSSRMGPEEFEFATPSMATLEKHLFGEFGRYIRSRQHLPHVHIPGTKEELSAGFAIDTRLFDGVEHFALIDSGGSIVAVISGGALIATVHLVALSVYLTTTIDEIMASFLDPDGGPLFTPR